MIKVVDYTNIPVYRKELVWIKIHACSDEDQMELVQMAREFDYQITDARSEVVLLEGTHTEEKHHEFIQLLQTMFCNRLELVRGGSVAIEAVSVRSDT